MGLDQKIHLPDKPPNDSPHPDMIWIPGGAFRMGSQDFFPEERPVHEVTVDGFWMDRYTVTNEQFARFVAATGYVTLAERPLNPAAFLGAPAEWEFAARGGLGGAIFTWGNEEFRDGKPMANTWQDEFPWQNMLLDGYEETSPVDSFPAHGYELYDMAGNVWE
jgi:formylglycine-generating enzyme required for sulfatase activity